MSLLRQNNIHTLRIPIKLQTDAGMVSTRITWTGTGFEKIQPKFTVPFAIASASAVLAAAALGWRALSFLDQSRT
jgi:hypothetical protein